MVQDLGRGLRKDRVFRFDLSCDVIDRFVSSLGVCSFEMNEFVRTNTSTGFRGRICLDEQLSRRELLPALFPQVLLMKFQRQEM